MSKSYTLADDTTVTVNVTDNGVPFNEGMNVLSKAIKAKINTSSGGGSSKLEPTLSLGEWAGSNNTYSAVVSYNGDGVLTANTGTLNGSTITVEDADGNFSGVISAAEGTNFAPSKLAFAHSKETVSGGGSGKPVPELYVEDFSAGGLTSLSKTHPITYTGDVGAFEIYARKENSEDVNDLGVTFTGNASTGYYMHVTAPAGFYSEEFLLYAHETNNYAEACCHFYVDTGD